MDAIKFAWGIGGGIVSTLITSFFYLITSHSNIVHIKDDIQEIKHYMKTIEKCVPHLDQIKHKH